MKSFEERLAAESAAWVEHGIVSPEQRTALLARHPVSDRAGNRFIAILGMIGGGLLAAGVALLIAAHWEQIDDWVKIAGLVALLVGTYVAGWRLQVSPGRYPRIGEACFMAGCVLFFLGIALVAQIFHLSSRPASGLLLWWIGIVALPWLVASRGAQLVSLAAMLIWLGMEFTAADSWLRLGNGEGWRIAELFPPAFFLVGTSVFLTGTALRGGRHARFAGLHEEVGLLLANAALYALSFEWSRTRWAEPGADVKPRWVVFAILAVVMLLAAVWAWSVDRAEVRRMALWWTVGAVASVGFLATGNAADQYWIWGAAACVGLFLLNLGMIRAGLATGRESWINLGVAFVALNILTRYFDLFGTMLEGGVFFAVTGAIVLALGLYLERKRRLWLAAMHRKEGA
jgi:uncharacterized membrane protein